MSENKEIIVKKPGCGMNFNCEVMNFEPKLVRLWCKLRYIEDQLKDKLSEEDLGYLTQARYMAEDLVQQFHREYEVKNKS